MAAVDSAAPRGHDKKKGKKRKKMRRLGVRIDMTPMVDVAFLLLTFFMLTTTMSRPQTMEINIPPGNQKVDVRESDLMTIRVKEDGSIFWNMGWEKPAKLEYKELRTFLANKLQENPRLITLLKVDRKGKYAMMVDIMDEFNLANITKFSIAPMEDVDKEILKRVSP
jgi:biopolymer transport protein ExbD